MSAILSVSANISMNCIMPKRRQWWFASVSFPQLAPKPAVLGELTQNSGHCDVQGHWRSPIKVLSQTFFHIIQEYWSNYQIVYNGKIADIVNSRELAMDCSLCLDVLDWQTVIPCMCAACCFRCVCQSVCLCVHASALISSWCNLLGMCYDQRCHLKLDLWPWVEWEYISCS